MRKALEGIDERSLQAVDILLSLIYKCDVDTKIPSLRIEPVTSARLYRLTEPTLLDPCTLSEYHICSFLCCLGLNLTIWTANPNLNC